MQRIDLTQTMQADAIALTCQVLSAGGLVLFPTETTYGAGVDATNPAAVAKLLAYKSRREGKPLSIACANAQMAEKYVEINDQARTLYAQFLPGPVTVVSAVKPGAVAPGVASEFGTLGVRIPDYQLILDIVSAYGKPMTATSANASGKARPYNVDSCIAELSNKQRELIDLVLDAGELPPTPPSTVIDTTLSTPVTLRAGDVVLDSTTPIVTLTSHSPAETQDIAGKFLLKHWQTIRETGLIVGLDGSLGVGKTVFTQGVAKFLGISERLTSPTYSYIEEYSYQRHGAAGMLYHLDLWKISDAAELERLELGRLLHPSSVVVVEWFAPFAQALEQLAASQNVPALRVTISDETESTQQRQLQIQDTPN